MSKPEDDDYAIHLVGGPRDGEIILVGNEAGFPGVWTTPSRIGSAEAVQQHVYMPTFDEDEEGMVTFKEDKEGALIYQYDCAICNECQSTVCVCKALKYAAEMTRKFAAERRRKKRLRRSKKGSC